MQNPRTTFALILCYVLSTGALFVYSARKPYHNWDMIVYAASARALTIKDSEALRASIYSDLESSVPEATYAELTRGTYRETVSRDTEAFRQQLPLYQIRVVYSAAILLMAALGINVFTATHVVSALGVVAGLWLVLIAFRPWVPPILLALIPVLAIPFGLVDVAKYSTPDGLAFLMVCLSVLLLLRDHWGLFVALPLCVLVRTDLIVFVAVVGAYRFFRRERRLRTVVSTLAGIVAYVGVNEYFGNYGLATTYHMTFVEQLAYPAQAQAAFGVNEYLTALRAGIGEAVTNPAFLLFTGVCIIAGYLLWKRRAAPRHMAFVVASSLLYVIIHFKAFPEIEERLFLGQYVVALAALLSLLRTDTRSAPSREEGS